MLINKKKKIISSCRLCHYNKPHRENERRLKDKQIFRPCQRTKRLWHMRVMMISIIVDILAINSPHGSGKETGGIEN